MMSALSFPTLPLPLEPRPTSLGASIACALESRGAGFRWKLGQFASRACDLGEQTATELAEGIEYFHHASLIFDDLPSMDDATERRGRPCLHLVTGESTAILTALALINRAYTTCWKACLRHPERAVMANRLIGSCIGESGILDGQARDLSFRSGMGEREIRAIACGKTGTLLKLTLMLPAVLAGAGHRELLSLNRLAYDWGIAYQGLDDFSDLLLSDTASGKTPMRDLSMERPNLVVAMGIRGAHAEVQQRLDRAIAHMEALMRLHPRWSFLAAFHARFADKQAALEAAIEAA